MSIAIFILSHILIFFLIIIIFIRYPDNVKSKIET